MTSAEALAFVHQALEKSLEKAVARYTGEKGNLKFPLDQPVPYALITRIVQSKVKQNRANAASTKKRRAVGRGGV